MTADALPALTAAVRRRSQLTRDRVHDALRHLDQASAAVTFAAVAVAGQAGASRSWLYRQPNVCAETNRLH